MKREHRRDGQATRRKIYETAIRLFRKRGFEQTTMRAIAKEAELSLGAAYHYYASKHAIVLGFYEDAQQRHEELAEGALAEASGLGERLRAVFHTKLDSVEGDRELMAAIVKILVDPKDPMSAFSSETRHFRTRTLRILERALDGTDVPAEKRTVIAWASWALVMAILLYFVHDESPNQIRTRELVDGATALLPPIVLLLGAPMAAPFWTQLTEILHRTGLIPIDPSPPSIL